MSAQLPPTAAPTWTEMVLRHVDLLALLSVGAAFATLEWSERSAAGLVVFAAFAPAMVRCRSVLHTPRVRRHFALCAVLIGGSAAWLLSGSSAASGALQLVPALLAGMLGNLVLRPLPPGWRGNRFYFGLYALLPGGVLAAALWFLFPAANETARAMLLTSAALLQAQLLALRGANRGRTLFQGAWHPSLRLRCPRCGLVCDFARDLGACSGCGLFLRAEWGAFGQGSVELPLAAAPELAGECPHCRRPVLVARGRQQCHRCQTPLALRWAAQSELQPRSPA